MRGSSAGVPRITRNTTSTAIVATRIPEAIHRAAFSRPNPAYVIPNANKARSESDYGAARSGQPQGPQAQEDRN